MRDPKRIQQFCNRLARAWEMVPDLRFGQLITNVICEMQRDPFFMEDDEMIQCIEKFAVECSPYYVPPKEGTT